MDVVKRDTIYDIKFTSNYEVGKFVSSSQHRIYLYCSDLPKFQYLVSDGKEYWIEDYHNHANIENELKGMISDFMNYLDNDIEAKEMFLTKWESK
jgi:carbonic anhydrase